MPTRLHRTVADRFPAAEVVAPDLIRVPLKTPTLPPATTTNHYLVGGENAVLVDPSTPLRSLQRGLVRLVRDLQDVHGWRLQALFLTHHHRDHVGAAVRLAAELGVPVRAHRTTAELLKGVVAVDELVQDGDVVAGIGGACWRGVHTPGHAAGHLVLHQRGGGMIAGDMVAGEGTILIDPVEGNMGDYLASLERMRMLHPAFLAPAHGPLLRDADAAIEMYRAHRMAREDRVRAALTDAPQRPDELLAVVYGDVARTTWPIALRSLRSHLQHLLELGFAKRHGDRWERVAQSNGRP